MSKALEILVDLFGEFNLTMCTKKTETMILNWAGRPEEYPKSIVTVRGHELKNVATFQYLGVKLNYLEPSTGATEITHRINLAKFKFRELKTMFKNKDIDLQTRLLFYNAFVRSRMTYGGGHVTTYILGKVWLVPAILSILRFVKNLTKFQGRKKSSISKLKT